MRVCSCLPAPLEMSMHSATGESPTDGLPSVLGGGLGVELEVEFPVSELQTG